jgi:choline dehydrogenase-like flavoprotein
VTSPVAETTDFSRDVLGRYLCNGFDEAVASAEIRAFDTVVIGAGAFGGVVAQHLLYSDQQRAHRTLLLEAGPFVLPEHVQNLPMLGLNVPDPAVSDPGPRCEVWGLPWISDIPGGTIGLAYCVGGRSIYWGGWAPRLLAEETPSPPWPASALADLESTYLQHAADQLGVSAVNEFVFGDLQAAMRNVLFDAIPRVAELIPLADLPDYAAVPVDADRHLLLDLLALPLDTPDSLSDDDLRNLLKLEAPLAVQSKAPLPGSFALNKFSAVPLILEASRAAWVECGGNDADRRLMVVPRCHVIRLETTKQQGIWHVTDVVTNHGTVHLPPSGRVVLATATIENTRLALASFAGLGMPNYEQIGANFQVHMRSNLIVRIPKTALPGLAGVRGLQAAALVVKGRHVDDRVHHFHLQITASGLQGLDTNAEAKLFKTIPDVDTVDAFRSMTEDHVVIAIRGVAEMDANNPRSMIRLASARDEFGVPRAFVSVTPTAGDLAAWDACDAAALAVATAFAGHTQCEVIAFNRDGLGTTYHEGGSLAMGDSADTSVTNADTRFHLVDNVYVTGPALFPTTGSANPMLTGVALARRLADHLV